MKLPIRTINALEQHANVFTVRALLQKTPKEILALPNFGEKTLETIYEALAEFGFHRPNSKTSLTARESETRRKELREMLGGTAADDWDAEIVFSKARAGKRKPNKKKNPQ